jgi:hypothetical protein
MPIPNMPGDDLIVDHRRGVVLGVLSLAGRVRQNGGSQHVVRVGVGTAYTFVDHVGDRQGRIPLHVHAHLEKHGHDAGILADRAMPFGAHTGVDQDLRHGIFCRRVFLFLIGFVHRLHEIDRVVVGDEL